MSDKTPPVPIADVPGDADIRATFMHTDEEWEVVKQLRAKVADVPASDYWKSEQCLHRFVRARKLDLHAAEEQYTEAMEWRQTFKADTAYTWFWEPEITHKYYPSSFHGTDNDGFPILLEFTGRTDVAPLFEALGEEDFLRYVCWYHERQEEFMRHCRAADGTSRHKMSVVVDLAGMSMRHATTSMYGALQKRVRLEEDNYPEVVRTVSLVNAPTIFTGIWAIVSAFLDEGTRSKISIHGSKFAPALEAKGVRAAALPDVLGGEVADHGIHLGGILPLHFKAGYGSEGDTVELGAGRVLELAVPLAAGETLAWDFTVADGRDVEFSAYAVPVADALAAGVEAGAPLDAPHGSSATGYAVVRPTSCMYDDGSTTSVELGADAPYSGASEVSGKQSMRSKTFKHDPREGWKCLQSPGRVKNASNQYPLETKLPVTRFSACASHPPPRVGAHWSATPPVPTLQGAGEAAAEAGTAAAPAPQEATPPAATAEGATPPAIPGTAPAALADSSFIRADSGAACVAVLRWSNAYSWMRGKTVARRVTLWSAAGAAAAVEMEPTWAAAKQASFDKTPGAPAAAASGTA